MPTQRGCCLLTQEVWLGAHLGVWLCAHPGGVAVCPYRWWQSVLLKRCDCVPTKEVGLCAHPGGVAVCPPKRCGCLPLRGEAMCPLGLWLCAQRRGVAVCVHLEVWLGAHKDVWPYAHKAAVGCPQRRLAVCPQSCGCASTKKRWLYAF